MHTSCTHKEPPPSSPFLSLSAFLSIAISHAFPHFSGNGEGKEKLEPEGVMFRGTQPGNAAKVADHSWAA